MAKDFEPDDWDEDFEFDDEVESLMEKEPLEDLDDLDIEEDE